MLLLIHLEIEISYKGKIIKIEKIESDAPYIHQNILSFLNKEKEKNASYFILSNYRLKSMKCGDVEYEEGNPSFLELKRIIEDNSF